MFGGFRKGGLKARSGKRCFGTQKHPFQACLKRSAEALDFSDGWESSFERV